MALESTDYVSRDDFCSRSREIFDAIAQVSVPPVVDRVGLRYIDRFEGPLLDHMHEYVVPPLRVLHGNWRRNSVWSPA